MKKPHYFTKNFLVIILIGLCLFLVILAEQASAQTTVTQIENADGDSVFTVFEDGALLGLGEFGTGIIPVEGGGTRMMWYPAKAAFRAGNGGTDWNDANIGDYSVAFGANNKASGLGSITTGISSSAIGDYSIAMGQTASATGDHSIAMGGATIAGASYATAIGGNAQARGEGSTALGISTTAETDYSLSIGAWNSANTSADNTLFVAGNGTSSTPSDALVLDQNAGLVVKGEKFSGVIPATGAGTRMMWHPAKAAFRAGEVDDSQWDDSNIGENSVAFGEDTEASGIGSMAMGFGTTAATGFSLSIGAFNSANTSADQNLFVVGNGSSGSRSDALVLDQFGDLDISGSLNQNSDRRLKEKIQPFGAGVLDALDQIRPVRYRFKNQQTHPSGKQIGLIAQEVQKEFPELINKNSQGYLSVSYSKFTAVLLKGMQEQQKQLEQQRAQNKTQSRQIATLQKRLDQVEREEQRTANLPSTATIMLGALLAGGLIWKTAKNNDK